MWRQGGWSPESGRILACDRPDWHKPAEKFTFCRGPLGPWCRLSSWLIPWVVLLRNSQAAVEAILDFGDDLVVQVKDRRQGGQELPLAMLPGSFLVFHLEVPRRPDGLLGDGVHFVGPQVNLRLRAPPQISPPPGPGHEQGDLQGLLVPAHLEGFAQPRPAQPGANRAALLLQAGDIIMLLALYPASWLTSSRRGRPASGAGPRRPG